MSKYMLIESRDPFTAAAFAEHAAFAAELAASGHDVTLFLVENGVLAAREGAECSALQGARGAGVKVLADSFSLKERGVHSLNAYADLGELSAVIDAMAEGCKTVWH